MKKKIVSYKEVELDKELKEKCIEYLKNNKQIFNWDYKDQLSIDQIKKITESQEAYYSVIDEMYEYNQDYIYDLECQLLENMKQEFSELKEIETSDLREEFIDHICIDLNIKELLNNTSAVNIRVVIHSNYEGVDWAERGEGDFKDSEYIEEIKKLLKDKYEKKSFQDELDNICSCCNQLIFYFKLNIDDLIGIKEKFKNEINIPKEALCGFFDSFNGSGSLLEIELKEDITLNKQWGSTKYDDINIILDETNSYSVKETYGLCNIPETTITVK